MISSPPPPPTPAGSGELRPRATRPQAPIPPPPPPLVQIRASRRTSLPAARVSGASRVLAGIHHNQRWRGRRLRDPSPTLPSHHGAEEEGAHLAASPALLEEEGPAPRATKRSGTSSSMAMMTHHGSLLNLVRC
uniref:Uncharacterized protein n=1 Tax=Triticum urartu TaxID=4572 RepID=A0A8R7THB8_TRIUA